MRAGRYIRGGTSFFPTADRDYREAFVFFLMLVPYKRMEEEDVILRQDLIFSLTLISLRGHGLNI